MKKSSFLVAVLLIVVISLGACVNLPAPTLTNAQQTAVYQTLTAIASENIPSQTPLPSPTNTPEPTNTATATQTPVLNTSIGPDNFPEDVDPLKGMKV